VAFFADPAAATEFQSRCPEQVLVLDLRLGAPGAHRRLPSGIEPFGNPDRVPEPSRDGEQASKARLSPDANEKFKKD
jgi:hypothetical protein